MRYSALSFLLFLLASSACVEPFPYTPGSTQEFILIDGVISNSEGERLIRIQKGNGFDSLRFKGIKVRGSIFRNNEAWGDLEEIETGKLRVPINLNFEPGNTYSIQIRTEEGQVFRSRPQLLPELIQTDSLSFALEREVSVSAFSGATITQRFVRVYSHLNFQSRDKTAYVLGYNGGVYTFRESIAPIRTCYIPYDVSQSPISLLSSEGLQDQVQHRVASQIINHTLVFEHMFNIYLHTITQESYDYYASVNRINQLEGNLYDEIPGPLKGNVFQESGSPLSPLGHISFALVDTARIKIRGDDLGVNIFNQCQVPNPCDVNPSCVCADCLAALPGASLEQPDYWNE